MSPRAPFRNRSAVLFALYNESVRRGWTNAQMAAAAGVERNTVPSWCRGDRTPNVFNLELWAKRLGGYLHFTIPDGVELPPAPVIVRAPRAPIVRKMEAKTDATA